MSVKHPVERGGAGRGRFDRVAERASNVASSPAFFAACVALIVAWVLAYTTGWPDDARQFLGDTLAAVTLALVALLKNAERRAEHAVQFKLDAIARALLADQGDDPDYDERARAELKSAIKREEDV
jgi:low affinity Fe/Cu permease